MAASLVNMSQVSVMSTYVQELLCVGTLKAFDSLLLIMLPKVLVPHNFLFLLLIVKINFTWLERWLSS